MPVPSPSSPPVLTVTDRRPGIGRRAAAGNQSAMLAGELRAVRTTRKNRALQALRIKNAAKHLVTLPQPGEAVHCVMRGNYNAWDLVPAVLRLGGRPIRHLDVATLGFNKQNAIQLCELIDRGQIGTVTFLCSLMYFDQERAVCASLAEDLARRPGCRFSALRNHAKVILFDLGDGPGDRLIIEGSANLRSCRNVEQFVFLADPAIWQFHHDWIDDLAGQNPYDPTRPVRKIRP